MSTPSAEHAVRIDPTRCPLCGQPNRCANEAARASGGAQPPCWCSTAHIAPAVLARIPPAARHRACLCAGCATPGGPP